MELQAVVRALSADPSWIPRMRILSLFIAIAAVLSVGYIAIATPSQADVSTYAAHR